jgi:hypothetical protein
VWTGDLAPDNADLGASHRFRGAVDVCYALTEIPSCRFYIVDAFKLKERGAGVRVALSGTFSTCISVRNRFVERTLAGRKYAFP